MKSMESWGLLILVEVLLLTMWTSSLILGRCGLTYRSTGVGPSGCKGLPPTGPTGYVQSKPKRIHTVSYLEFNRLQIFKVDLLEPRSKWLKA